MRGIESHRIADAMEELNEALDGQANELDDLREHVLRLLLKPLVDEEGEETTGEEYDQSTKLQDEILVYHQILRTTIADRQAAITGQKNTLVEHEIDSAVKMAERGQGPYPEKLLELIEIRRRIKPPFVEGNPLSSLRGLVSELRALSTRLRHEAATGSARAKTELHMVTIMLERTLGHLAEQSKAATAMERENELFMDTLNARIEYYRQLQEVSDMVGEYEGSMEPTELARAIEEARSMEARLQEKLNAAEAKHRYREFSH
jgi:E3 ubiquitin-protein ligase SHPRH